VDHVKTSKARSGVQRKSVIKHLKQAHPVRWAEYSALRNVIGARQEYLRAKFEEDTDGKGAKVRLLGTVDEEVALESARAVAEPKDGDEPAGETTGETSGANEAGTKGDVEVGQGGDATHDGGAQGEGVSKSEEAVVNVQANVPGKEGTNDTGAATTSATVVSGAGVTATVSSDVQRESGTEVAGRAEGSPSTKAAVMEVTGKPSEAAVATVSPSRNKAGAEAANGQVLPI
jgi:hypothetical protein